MKINTIPASSRCRIRSFNTQWEKMAREASPEPPIAPTSATLPMCTAYSRTKADTLVPREAAIQMAAPATQLRLV